MDQELDTGEWVDVGVDGRWRPSAADRFRSMVVLGLVFGALTILAVVLSVGDDGDDEDVAATTSSTAETTVPDTASTALPDPTSVGGEPAPEPCGFDLRDGAPLREPTDTVLLVRNGTPQGGHAGMVSDRLDGLGYTTVEPGNAPIQEGTVIEYRSGWCAEAVRLLDDLAVEGAAVQLLDPGNDSVLGLAHVLVTLGRDSL